MAQMILDGHYMPHMDYDAYACWETPLVTQIEMISGRVVSEVRGGGSRYKVWRGRAAFDLLDNDLFQAIYPVLKSGKPFPASMLPPTGTQMISGTFIVESLTDPSFAFSDGGEPVWHGLALQIREVSPHA